MIAAVLTITVAVLAGLLGAVVHECCHYLAARLLGRPARIDWIAMDTLVRFPEGEIARRDRVIAGAPYAVASVLFALWLVAGLPWLLPTTLFLAMLGAVDVVVGDHSDAALLRGEPEVIQR